MNRIAKFEKVSLNQFKDDWIDTFGNKGNDIITLNYLREQRLEARDMIFICQLILLFNLIVQSKFQQVLDVRWKMAGC